MMNDTLRQAALGYAARDRKILNHLKRRLMTDEKGRPVAPITMTIDERRSLHEVAGPLSPDTESLADDWIHPRRPGIVPAMNPTAPPRIDPEL